jgi:hypothetical protein
VTTELFAMFIVELAGGRIGEASRMRVAQGRGTRL